MTAARPPLKWKTLSWHVNPRTGIWTSTPYSIEKVVKRRTVVGYWVKRAGALLCQNPVCLARARRLAEEDAEKRAARR